MSKTLHHDTFHQSFKLLLLLIPMFSKFQTRKKASLFQLYHQIITIIQELDHLTIIKVVRMEMLEHQHFKFKSACFLKSKKNPLKVLNPLEELLVKVIPQPLI